jgi:formylglycine-generating enzyme required for sulfatase activity
MAPGTRRRRTLWARAWIGLLAGLAAGGIACAADFTVSPDEPNTVLFPATEARFVRLTIHAATVAQACLDELEVYGPASADNLALAAGGARPAASSCLQGYAIHRVEHLNDGQYGNSHSWIAGSTGEEWAQIELPAPAMIDRVVFTRDRAEGHRDRLPRSFSVLVSSDGREWRTVRHVADAVELTTETRLIRPNRANVFDFPPVEARTVRITILRGLNTDQPCIDELEVYGPGSERNLATAPGATAQASSCLAGYPIHQIAHLNDGRAGNDHSWIAAELPAWAQVTLPSVQTVSRVVFARDRDKVHRDRLPLEFRIQVSLDGETWRTVKAVVAITEAPLDRPLEDETPAEWALRVAEDLPGALGAEAAALAQKVVAEADAQPVLDLYALHQRRLELQTALPLHFNPAAIRRAVADLQTTYPETYHAPDDFATRLEAFERELPQIQAALATDDPARLRQAVEQAGKLIAFQREALLSNPLLAFSDLLVLQRRVPPPRTGDVYWDWGQRYGMTVNWSCDFRPKNPPVAPWWDDMIAAVPWRQGMGAARPIVRPEPGHMIQHPDLHFDGKRLLFTMPGPDDAFQVFEVNVDGTGLRQVTHDTPPDVDNGDPCYLPDGRVVFNSTRSFAGVPCEDGASYVSNLCLTDLDGSATRMLTFDQESNWYPTVMADGRVLYTRYEYANVSHQFGRLLFAMNPDGTQQMEYYGSDSYWPNSLFYARPIPGESNRFVGVVCGHHGPNRTGPLVLFDTSLGRRETSGAVQFIPGYGKPVRREVEDYLYEGNWPKFAHPWPLSGKYFLAAARLHPAQEEYAIYLVDVFDNVTELCRLEGYSLLEPIPLQPRPTPPVIPDRIQPGAEEASIFLLDVYRGPQMQGVPRGTVKKLRLFSYNYVYRDAGSRGFGHLATAGVDGPWEPRYLLGTVPVREDGSALFSVPANVPISVQPLDAQGRALQVMRSWYTAMPGEKVTCVGCHEPMSQAPPVTPAARAINSEPERIEPWRGKPRGFDFELEVQPVLDRFCVGCHDGQAPGRPDLSRKTDAEKLRINGEYHRATESTVTPILTPAFIALHPYVRRPFAESCYTTKAAGEYWADTSPLVQLLKKGHHGVRLDAEAWDRLYTWIDLSAPDQGSWKHSEWGVPGNHYERRLASLAQFGGRKDDVEWLPDPGPAPAFVPPAPLPAPDPSAGDSAWAFPAEEAARRQQSPGQPPRLAVALPGGQELDLILIPPGEYLMGDGAGSEDEGPPHRVRITEPFYLSRTEVSNAQYAAVMGAGHDSGIEDWRSIDWRGEGYPLNEPTQPVVRVSWDEATGFCQALARLTGRPAALPTEAQWEWACRAGAATPLWYGDLDADFSRRENLAGQEQRGFACDGKAKWCLRDDRFSDGQMVSAPVGSFQPNPWGLQDMAGNVSEWTASAYAGYPYSTDEGRGDAGSADRVVRGGSWDDRPVRARSAFRWHYPPWLRVHTVGFRVALPAG